MSTDRWMRASDQDRDQAVELLRDAYAAGRLSREELGERSMAAYSAGTWGELHDLTADLPGPPARVGLPSDAVVPMDTALRARRWARGQIIWSFTLVLAAGLAGRAFPATVWVIAVLIWLALVLPFTARRFSRWRR